MKRSSPSTIDNKSLESSNAKQPTLMDQWKEHYDQRDFTTKPHHLHRMGLCTFAYCLFVVPAICAFFIAPYMELSLLQWVALTALSLFLMTQILMNFIACQRLHHNKDIVFCFYCNKSHNPLLQQVNTGAMSETEGWKACLKCQRNSPPRSHHCKLCGECVLRRGHHCYFLCCCVGHHNQKHFLVLCFYCILGLMISCYFVAAGITDQFNNSWRLLLPVTLSHWASGHCSAFAVLLTGSLYLKLGCLGVAVVYLLLEAILVLRGQTFYEMGRNSQRYNLGVVENLHCSLGTSCLWWPMLFVFPFNLSQSSDGITWRMTKHY